ncbi:hypothetical protein WKI68_13325 [Streptomyces sp. MS1.HAVA.3]|uniref:Uncharacterized protein n=1 Tax=Streptomyces caledonius TaxID=3134107 RepID=A0ABU8U3T5_9ACTN
MAERTRAATAAAVVTRRRDRRVAVAVTHRVAGAVETLPGQSR